MGSTISIFLTEGLSFLFFYATLAVLVFADKFIIKKNKQILLIAIGLGILNMIINYVELWSNNAPGTVHIREIASYTGYSLRPFLMLCFLKLMIPNKKHIIFWGLAILNAILHYTSHYTHLCVYFTEDNHFQRGPLWLLVFIICGVGLLSMGIYPILNHHKQKIRRWLIPPLCSLLILHAVLCDFEYRNPSKLPSHLDQTLLIVMFLFYIFYHLLLSEQYQEKMAHNQQLQLMISQIKPHFFFNTITTIQALCTIDPKKASDTLRIFANYVRQNLTSQNNHLIPFDREIQHVKTYVDIETLRFPNIEVQYDLSFTDFDIATLSIQPLVENAIKHGIRSKEHGCVLISTQKLDNAITVTIKDNGIGFDTKILETSDDTHIGLRNVRSRLKFLQNATMEINSSSDGTTITITIPWEN